jgi:hypothetical protein
MKPKGVRHQGPDQASCEGDVDPVDSPRPGRGIPRPFFGRRGLADDVVRVEVGQIQGARFAIANPAVPWNRRILLVAHGYRPESAPLIADLHPDRASVKAALDEGWIVATTSYRRNGLVIGDAIADLDALRAYIVAAYGEPERVVIEGDSSGGLIATIISEREKGLYDGAIAFDATLYIKEANSQVGLSLQPRIPLLFVATVREAKEPKSYLTALVSRPPPLIQPALFLISREGHTNINQPERIEAFRSLNAWIDGGRDALPRPKDQAPYFDATVAPEPGPSTAIIHEDHRGLDTRVAEVDQVYGTLLLEAQAQGLRERRDPADDLLPARGLAWEAVPGALRAHLLGREERGMGGLPGCRRAHGPLPELC